MDTITTKFSGQVANSRINSRIESVEDPKLNKALFMLYEQLINPFKEIEDLQAMIIQAKNRIKANQTEMNSFFYRIKTPGFITSGFAFAIICLLLFSWAGNGFDLMLVMQEYIPISDGVFLILFGIVLPLLIGFGLCAIVAGIKNIKLSSNNEELSKSVAVFEQSIEKKIAELGDVVSFIPPQYRYSQALAFFVESYSNSKIDNLKEAVNLYDTHDYRNKMLDSQAEIIDRLENISFNQLMLVEQLDKLNKNIWFSNIVF